MFKRFLAALIALLMALAVIPTVFAETGEDYLDYQVPEGYNEAEYYAALAFLEIEDENGVKNGQKIRSDYDPEDPETWYYTDESTGFNGLQWVNIDEEDEMVLYAFALHYISVVGVLDLTECHHLWALVLMDSRVTDVYVPNTNSEMIISFQYNSLLTNIDMSQCIDCPLIDFYADDNPSLETLDLSMNPGLNTFTCVRDYNLTSVTLPQTPQLSSFECYDCDLSELDITGCSGLMCFICYNNHITELDLSECPDLLILDCHDNELTELDLSPCTGLFSLDCSGNNLNEIDLSENLSIPIDSIRADGSGKVGIKNLRIIAPECHIAYAYPEEGESFIGWYNEAGELLSEEAAFDYSEIIGQETVFIARFTGGAAPAIPGDVDGSGEVNITDALLALRAAMGVIELTPEQLAAADMNGSGTAEVSDAIIILRMAMGLLN